MEYHIYFNRKDFGSKVLLNEHQISFRFGFDVPLCSLRVSVFHGTLRRGFENKEVI